MGLSETATASISHLEFCPNNGILVAAQARGVVRFHHYACHIGGILWIYQTAIILADISLM